MLLLIVADWHELGVIEQDIRRHEHRVEKEPGVDRLLLARLVLKLGHALELAERTEATENPGELGVPDDVRLHEEPAPGWVQTASHVLG